MEYTDYINKHKDNLFICNREPFCDHRDNNECDCNHDDHIKINLKIDILSNNQCIIEIILSEKFNLKKDHDWMIFILDSEQKIDNFDMEHHVLHIQLIDQKLKFYIHNKNTNMIFTLDNPFKKINKYTYNIMFDYMNFN